ncbi:hypothetical protein FRX31_018362 [Thalictrum thalictroides]|uniref:Uncharacterized protein n=1 Tax=Thalictrum thalictroides TaxID=46969 RepID=A0A7J6W679_THATH|nr:hypothetical protein FRX31_018362 [Thalictrum thalictroides]
MISSFQRSESVTSFEWGKDIVMSVLFNPGNPDLNGPDRGLTWQMAKRRGDHEICGRSWHLCFHMKHGTMLQIDLVHGWV